MGSGGSRNRSGPPPDPASKRSDKRGIVDGFRTLPAEGYDGKVPAWPLPTGLPRERALWKKLWKFPQAEAWADQPWQHLQIAHYIRWAVKAEARDANASTMTQATRLADSIGLTAAGLRENGWVILPSTKGGEASPAPSTAAKSAASRRLRAVNES